MSIISALILTNIKRALLIWRLRFRHKLNWWLEFAHWRQFQDTRWLYYYSQNDYETLAIISHYLRESIFYIAVNKIRNMNNTIAAKSIFVPRRLLAISSTVNRRFKRLTSLSDKPLQCGHSSLSTVYRNPHRLHFFVGFCWRLNAPIAPIPIPFISSIGSFWQLVLYQR